MVLLELEYAYLQAIATLAPLRTMSSTVSFPMPVLHPVITTVLPFILALQERCFGSGYQIEVSVFRSKNE